VQAARDFGPADLKRLADVASQTFITANKNVCAAFQMGGEDGLITTLGDYILYKNVCQQEMNDAIESKDERRVLLAFKLAFSTAFVELLERGALSRIQLVEQFDKAGMAEYARMRALAKPPAQPMSAPGPVEPSLDPIEECVQAFKGGMGSPQFKAVYVNGPKRAIFDRGVAQGRL
jgi:hypothetical protein